MKNWYGVVVLVVLMAVMGVSLLIIQNQSVAQHEPVDFQPFIDKCFDNVLMDKTLCEEIRDTVVPRMLMQMAQNPALQERMMRECVPNFYRSTSSVLNDATCITDILPQE